VNPIETRDLAVVYRTGLLSPRVTGLDGLTLSVEPGEVFGYVGANGAGKTTTIKALLGLQRPIRGEAFLMGKPSRDPASRAGVGFLPEAPYFYEYLTGRETVEFYARLSGVERAERRRRAGEVLERVGLAAAADAAVRTYSRGMRQRLGLAQAMVHGPRVALLDEPMGGLDPVGRRDVRLLIGELARGGVTVFFSSHILSDVEALCDRVGFLRKGRLVLQGTVEELARARVAAVEIRCSGIVKDDLAPLGEAVSRMRRDGEVLSFEVPDEETANRAARLVVNRLGRILAVVPVRESLEQVFTRLETSLNRDTQDVQDRGTG
jgi:ABC-2 type transport system ATP-binding protein